MNRIVYIANARIPTERAHGIQIMKMCEAFADQGAQVELVVPNRRNTIAKNAFIYYGIKKNFSITKIPSVDTIRFGRIGFWLQSISFAIAFLFYARRKNDVDVFYSRDPLPLYLLSFRKHAIVWEAHLPQWNIISKRVAAHSKAIITITSGLKRFFVRNGARESMIFVLPDGVDLNQFNDLPAKEEVRKTLGLPLGKHIVMYTGHLYEWKGADVLARAAGLLPSDTIVIFIGGTEGDIARFREVYGGKENIIIAGQKPHVDIPLYQKAADVLVLPNSAHSELSAKYTSPMKLFEYMATGRPIVASNLSSLCEVINEESAVLVEPDNPTALAEGVQEILRSPAYGERIAENARRQVDRYTWQNRARAILSSLHYEAN